MSALIRVGLTGIPVMVQQLQSRQLKSWQSNWRTGSSQNVWLSMLVDAMEKFSRPELRAVPCDRLLLTAVRAQLARPASTSQPYSHFGLRN